MIKTTKKITICGAGLIGPYLAILMRKRGFEVEVIEKRDDIRKATAESGRSINLVITSRGIHALKKINLWKEAKKITMPVNGRMMHSVTGELTYQAYGGKSDVNYSISRTGLNRFLIDEAEKIGVKFIFGTSLVKVDEQKKVLSLEKDNETSLYNYDVLLGTDGAGSVVRKKVLSLHEAPDRVDWLNVSYKELFMPTSEVGEARIDIKSLHIWPRGKHMLMALPNQDQSFTMTLYLSDIEGEISFNDLESSSDIEKYFQDYHPDSIEYMPEYLKDFKLNKASRLGTVRSKYWYYKDQMCLVGDAAHAIVPFFGQGTNAGLEGCVVFDELLDKHDSWENLFKAFYETYKANADAIAKMAEENYVEMSEKVGDEKFLLRKKLESYLHEKFPTKFLNRYMMVTYSNIPYASVYEVGKIQSEFLDSLNIEIDDFFNIDLSKVEHFLDSVIVEKLEK
jgi:kynurenine 3-monooxygenase